MCACARLVVFVLVVMLAGAGAGCFGGKKDSPEQRTPAFTVRSAGTNANVTMTPARLPIGRIASVNAQAKFAVINFPVGQLPPNDTRFSIFHAGMKTGEIRITGPAQDTFTVGDIIAGTAQEGDEVRGE